MTDYIRQDFEIAVEECVEELITEIKEYGICWGHIAEELNARQLTSRKAVAAVCRDLRDAGFACRGLVSYLNRYFK